MRRLGRALQSAVWIADGSNGGRPIGVWIGGYAKGVSQVNRGCGRSGFGRLRGHGGFGLRREHHNRFRSPDKRQIFFGFHLERFWFRPGFGQIDLGQVELYFARPGWRDFGRIRQPGFLIAGVGGGMVGTMSTVSS